jgi:hypothetical protein
MELPELLSLAIDRQIDPQLIAVEDDPRQMEEG